MVTASSDLNGPPLTVKGTVGGLPIYLDNHSLIDLAKGAPSRRLRFIGALHQGADVLFSITNAAELIGPKEGSAEKLRAFLDEIGPHWFPVELNPHEVATRETHGLTGGDACIATDFMKQYFRVRTANYTPGSGKVIDLSADFFQLSAVLDWLQPQRESIRQSASALDEGLIGKIKAYRTEYDRSSGWLDEKFPVLEFNPKMPATFTYINLIRVLILEAKGYSLKKNDGIDFCHTVIGGAFASMGTLDKHWKRRLEMLPSPNQLARIYYGPELDQLVTDIEHAVKYVPRRSGSSAL